MEGRSVHQSQHHLNLQNMVSLQTKKLTKNYRNSRKAKSCENLATSKTPRESFMSSKNKPKWLFRLGIEQFIVKNNIQIPIELYDATEGRINNKTKSDLVVFVLSCTEQSL